MSRANREDIFNTEPGELWQKMVDSNRLIYAPKNEMSSPHRSEQQQQTAEEADQAAREMNQKMATHRAQLKRRLLEQQKAFRERIATGERENEEETGKEGEDTVMATTASASSSSSHTK